MKTTLMKVMPALALSGLMMASASWAMGHRVDMEPERMMARMSEHLDLSEEQEQQVSAILDENKDQTKADHERINEIRDALHQQREDFDAGEAQKLADELGEITTRMAFQAASKHARIYQLLDAEQREELEELKEKREKHKEKRWSKRHE